jgi:hypothetical protein
MKGGFIFEGDASRRNWKLRGPFFDGYETYDMVGDDSGGKPVLYAAVNTWTWGPVIYKSTDLGKSWKRAKNSPRFGRKKDGSSKGSKSDSKEKKKKDDDGLAVARIWNLQPDGAGKVYAGVEPAALFVSEDESTTWGEFDALNHHETRKKWNPGNGGLCLHTIVVNPRDRRKIRVGISAVGVMGSDDDGRSWRFMNKGIEAGSLPNNYPEFGQCVHKIDFHSSRPDTLFLQNHGGVYVSRDFGERWEKISKGLPSDFGFPICVHRNEPETVYVFPLNGMERFPPNGEFQAWATRNGGRTWARSSEGLPKHAYFGVLRDAAAVDAEEPGGIYCGTTTGQIYFSRDDARSWEKMVENLPRVTSVSCLAG